MKRLTGFIFTVLLLLSGCQKNFNTSQPGDSKMVVNSLYNSNGPMAVYLTTSYQASNKNNNVVAINDAAVALYENDIFKEYLHYIASDSANTFGYYASNLAPQNGKSYKLQVSEKNYPTVSVIDTIPLPSKIISCSLQQFPDTLTGNLIVNLQFQDNPVTTNYYHLFMYLVGTEYSINTQHDTVYQTFVNNVIPQLHGAVSDTALDPSKFLLFTNKGFSGQLKTLQIESSVKALSSKVTSAALVVELHAVSYAHYQYYRTLQIYNNTSSTTGIESYVYSNIINGYGIFCGENWQENTFKIR